MIFPITCLDLICYTTKCALTLKVLLKYTTAIGISVSSCGDCSIRISQSLPLLPSALLTHNVQKIVPFYSILCTYFSLRIIDIGLITDLINCHQKASVHYVFTTNLLEENT